MWLNVLIIIKSWPSINFNFLSNSYSYLTIWSGCYFHWMASQNRWPHSRCSSCILVTSCILQLTANAWQAILISHHYHKIHFVLSLFWWYHLIQISIVEEYRIFRTINLDKSDDFVYSTKNVYLYFDVGLFLNKKTRIIDVLGVIFF
jgi:hypothetical protein